MGSCYSKEEDEDWVGDGSSAEVSHFTGRDSLAVDLAVKSRGSGVLPSNIEVIPPDSNGHAQTLESGPTAPTAEIAGSRSPMPSNGSAKSGVKNCEGEALSAGCEYVAAILRNVERLRIEDAGGDPCDETPWTLFKVRHPRMRLLLFSSFHPPTLAMVCGLWIFFVTFDPSPHCAATWLGAQESKGITSYTKAQHLSSLNSHPHFESSPSPCFWRCHR